MRSAVRLLILCLASICLFSSAASASYLPDRRKPQFQKELGYYVFPSPYSIPGVGEGAVLIGVAMNVADSHTDLFGFALAGDLTGGGLGVIDIHLIPKTLILDVNAESLNNLSITSFSQRGMNTKKHDYSLLKFDNYTFTGGRLTSTFFDRRFEVYGGSYYINSKLDAVLDNEGKSIIDIQNPAPWRSQVSALGIRLDLTDDYSDPRRGLRMDVSRWWSPPKEQSDPDFYTMEYNATLYIPFGSRNTWAFNYFRADAHVVRRGETDRTSIAQEQDLNCSDPTLTPKEQQDCQDVIDNIIAANTYGTVSSLGGTSRLRSYPHDRFKGAHAVFYGTEFRLNLTEKAQPFNIFIAKDIRTVLQVAFFYELGSVEDERDKLGDILRSTYGMGFRMVTASGLVFRADVAAGSEGIEATIIFGYPWESF